MAGVGGNGVGRGRVCVGEPPQPCCQGAPAIATPAANGLGTAVVGNGIDCAAVLLRIALVGGTGTGNGRRRSVAGVVARRNFIGVVEYAAFYGGGGGGIGVVGNGTRGVGAPLDVFTRLNLFTVYGIARVFGVWYAAAVSRLVGIAGDADCAVCAAGLSVCNQRCIGSMGRFTACLYRSGAGMRGKPLASAGYGYTAFVATCFAAWADFSSGYRHRRIRRYLTAVAPRMDHFNYLDLPLFRQSGRRKSRQSGSADSFADGIVGAGVCGIRRQRT